MQGISITPLTLRPISFSKPNSTLNIFAPGHGKGPCDRAFASVKNPFLKVISHDTGKDITNASEMVEAFHVLEGGKDSYITPYLSSNCPHLETC